MILQAMSKPYLATFGDDMDNAEFLSMREATRQYGITRPTLLRRVRELRLPVYVDGLDRRRRWLRRSDLQELMRRRRVGSAPDDAST
jgi:hypothetical protein